MIERPRGTRDFRPEEMEKRRYVESIFRKTAESFGFREIMTPTFERAELFVARSGPQIVEDMYLFKDKAGREIVLRPEMTAPTIRFFVNDLQKEPKPLKLYYFGNCFRYERPQQGRYREFFHFGAEIIGASPRSADAECIALALTSLENAGLAQFKTRIGNVAILRKLIDLPRDQQAECLRFMDKKDFDGLKEQLERLNRDDLYHRVESLMELRGGTAILDEARELLRGKGCDEEIDYLAGLGRELRSYGIERYDFDLGVVRGLDYYAGMVFEVDSPVLGAESQICGGGSYSLSTILGGEEIFSTGFAVGFDRVVLALEREGRDIPTKKVEVFVVPIGDSARDKALEVLQQIRREGISADIDLIGRGPSKCLRYADSIGARIAVLIGEDELSRNSVALRDMASGEQSDVELEHLVPELKKTLAKNNSAPNGI